MPIPEELKENEKKRVLIVDDEENMAQSISRNLEKNGFETKIVTDGFQAGAFLATFKPHIMTLDLKMPGMDGFQMITFTRDSKEFHQIKILVISGLPSEELQEAVNKGADAFLEKPFNQRKLVEKIIALSKASS
jgi:DNA-binding response OmpR family regulator